MNPRSQCRHLFRNGPRHSTSLLSLGGEEMVEMVGMGVEVEVRMKGWREEGQLGSVF